MAQAPTYTPQTNFAQDEANNAGGRSTVRTANLDAEFDAIEVTADALCANLLLLQRDDGKLRDGLVEPYNFSTTSKAYINGADWVPRGLWVTARAYAVGDLIDQAGSSYLCAIAHTSGTFNTDYAAGKWQILVSTPTAASMSFAPTGTLSSTNVQSAIQEVDAKAIAVRSDLASSASSSVGGGMVAYDAQRLYPRNTVGDALQRTIDLISIPGSDPTGAADSTAALNIAIAMMAAQGGGAVDLTGGRWLLDSADIALSEGVYLVGPWRGNVGERLGLDYTATKGTIVLNSSYTVRPSRGAGVCGLIIMKKGLTTPGSLAAAGTLVASFAGKAITVGTGSATTGLYCDTYVGHCLILGFEYAYYLSYAERPRVEYVSGDCTNGIYIDQCYDMNHLSHCHFWPFLTTHQSWTLTGPAGYRRSGTAYRLGNVSGPADWGQAYGCFAYGYTTGFHISNSSNSVLVNCGADNNAAGGDTSTVGFLINGVSRDAQLIGCKAAAQGRGFNIDLDPTPYAGNTATLTGCQAWGTLTDHVLVNSGHATITGSTLRGAVTGAGINIVSTSLGALIDGNTFDSVTTPIIATGKGLEDTQVGINRYYNCVDATIGNRTLKNNQLAQDLWTKYSADSGAYTHIGRKARGTVAATTAALSGDGVMQRIAQIWDGSAWRNIGYDLWQADSTVGAGATPGTYIIATTPTGSTTPVQRVAVNYDGHFFPVTDNASDLGGASVAWRNAFFKNAATITSDARTKTGATALQYGLDFVNLLKPKAYRNIVGANEVQALDEGGRQARMQITPKAGQRIHFGQLAQDVKAAMDQLGIADFGGWCLENPDDPNSLQMLRPGEFIPVLIKAVQELSARVATLEAQ